MGSWAEGTIRELSVTGWMGLPLLLDTHLPGSVFCQRVHGFPGLLTLGGCISIPTCLVSLSRGCNSTGGSRYQGPTEHTCIPQVKEGFLGQCCWGEVNGSGGGEGPAPGLNLFCPRSPSRILDISADFHQALPAHRLRQPGLKATCIVI